MQVWKVLHAARCKCRTQNVAKNRYLGTIPQLCRAISLQLRHVSTIRKKLVKQQYLYMLPQYGELRPTSGWDRFVSLAAPHVISTGFASWQRYCTASSSGRQPNFAALNRGRHLCSAGRPSGWALAHISSSVCYATSSRIVSCVLQVNAWAHKYTPVWRVVCFINLIPPCSAAFFSWYVKVS